MTAAEIGDALLYALLLPLALLVAVGAVVLALRRISERRRNGGKR